MGLATYLVLPLLATNLLLPAEGMAHNPPSSLDGASQTKVGLATGLQEADGARNLEVAHARVVLRVEIVECDLRHLPKRLKSIYFLGRGFADTGSYESNRWTQRWNPSFSGADSQAGIELFDPARYCAPKWSNAIFDIFPLI